MAEQLSRQTSVQPAKILQSLVIPNKKKQGDLSISIFDVDPQLRTLKPDPQLISTRAQSIVNQVHTTHSQDPPFSLETNF